MPEAPPPPPPPPFSKDPIAKGAPMVKGVLLKIVEHFGSSALAFTPWTTKAASSMRIETFWGSLAHHQASPHQHQNVGTIFVGSRYVVLRPIEGGIF